MFQMSVTGQWEFVTAHGESVTAHGEFVTAHGEFLTARGECVTVKRSFVIYASVTGLWELTVHGECVAV